MFGKWIIYEVQLRFFEAMTDNGDNISPQVNRGISLLFLHLLAERVPSSYPSKTIEHASKLGLLLIGAAHANG